MSGPTNTSVNATGQANTQKSTNLEHALLLAEWGFEVFPLNYPKFTPNGVVCSCGKADCPSVGKHPLWIKDKFTRGHLSATRKTEDITLAWSGQKRAAYRRDANIGIGQMYTAPDGSSRRIIAIDIDGSPDPEKDGEITIKTLEAEHGPLPRTMEVKSGRMIEGRAVGGRHLIYLIPLSWEGTFKRTLGPGVDIKCAGVGYVAAPPSLHKSGRRYEWLTLMRPAEAPEWLMEACARSVGPEVDKGGSPERPVGDPFEPGSLLSDAVHGLWWQETRGGELEMIEAALRAVDKEYDPARSDRVFLSRDLFQEITWGLRALQDWFAREPKVGELAFAHAHQFAGHHEGKYFATLWNYRRTKGKMYGRSHLLAMADAAALGWRQGLTIEGRAAAARILDPGGWVVNPYTAALPEGVLAAMEPVASPIPPETKSDFCRPIDLQQPPVATPVTAKPILIRSHGGHYIAGAAEPISASRPRHSAEVFRKMHQPFLIYMNQDWLTWDGAAYVEISTEILHSDVSAFLANSFTRTKKEGPAGPNGAPGEITMVNAPFHPEPKHVNAVMAFLMDVCTESEELSGGPKWLKDAHRMAPASEYISFRNGILHIWSGQFQKPSPWLFTRNALDFEYDPCARAPERLHQFRHEVWTDPDEREEYSTSLQEFLGTAIANVANIQTILLLLGASRGGKGTVLRLMAMLAGKYNVGSTSASSLVGTFGLQSFIGKRLMMVPDLNIGPKTNKEELKTLLLNISGRDQVSINRKNKNFVHETLDCSVVIAANEIPAIPDASGALARRYIPIRFKQSFYGREDADLDDKLRAELPGIFLWALEGLKRVLRNKRFSVGELAKEELGEIKREGSPIQAFIEQECEIAPDGEESSYEMPRGDFFTRYEAWQKEQGQEKTANRVWAVRRLKEALGAKFGEIGDRYRAGRITGVRLRPQAAKA